MSSRRPNPLRACLGAALVSLVCASYPPFAAAQQRPTQNFLVGDRALGMAGAFVGLADDASAIFHNPAGLAFLPDGTLNTSLWASAYESQSYDAGFATPLGRSELSSLGLRSLPYFIAGSLRLRQAPGSDAPTKRHVVGFGVLTPFATRYGFSAQQRGDSSVGRDAAARLDVLHDESSQWYGVSYAYLISARASVGVSLFGSHWFLSHQESRLRAAEGPVEQLEAEELQMDTIRLQRRLVQLTLRLGGIWRPHPIIQLGLMLQPPGLNTYGSVSADGVRSDVVGGQAQLETLSVGDASVAPMTAWEIRTGAAIGQSDRGIVTVDLSVIGPDTKTEVPQGIQDWTGVDAFPHGTNLQSTLRGAIGYTMVIDERFPVRGGLLGEYTIPSDSNDLLKRVSRTQAVGAALSIGNRFTDFDLSLGVTGELESTRLLTPHFDQPDAPYLPTDMQHTTFFFYLSGGSKAARLLKQTLLDAL